MSERKFRRILHSQSDELMAKCGTFCRFYIPGKDLCTFSEPETTVEYNADCKYGMSQNQTDAAFRIGPPQKE